MAVSNRRRTILSLDEQSLREAQGVPGTTQVTETIHRTPLEVANQRQWLVTIEFDFPGLTSQSFEEMARLYGPAVLLWSRQAEPALY
jgi:hypothetical protein